MKQRASDRTQAKQAPQLAGTRPRRSAWRRAIRVAGVIGLVPPAALFGAQQSGGVDLGLNPLILGAALWIALVTAVTGVAIIIFERRPSA